MNLQGIVNITVSGMQTNTTRLHAAANNMANSQTPGYDNQGAQTVSTPENAIIRTIVSGESGPDGNDIDPASELLDAIRSGIEFKANALVFEAGADLWDVLKTMKRD